MSSRLITELSSILVEKHGLGKVTANRFVRQMIDVVNDGLRHDKIVKIKGLGTFKLTLVKDRESVNVSTGERIVIEGREKITFTPDTVLRDIINRPFSQFETVVLNDGVEFEELPDKVEPVEVMENNTVTEDIEPVTTSSVEVPVIEEQEPSEQLVDFVDDEEVDSDYIHIQKSSLRQLAFAAIVFLVAAGVLGWYLYQTIQEKNLLLTKIAQLEQKQVIVETDTTLTMRSDTVSETLMNDNEIPEETASQEQDEKKTTQPEQNQETQGSQYDSDPRIKYGAYRIIGVERTVVVQKGQSLSMISKAHLGPDMECYMEALNGKEVKEGQVIKIPKLQLKKRKNY